MNKDLLNEVVIFKTSDDRTFTGILLDQNDESLTIENGYEIIAVNNEGTLSWILRELLPYTKDKIYTLSANEVFIQPKIASANFTKYYMLYAEYMNLTRSETLLKDSSIIMSNMLSAQTIANDVADPKHRELLNSLDFNATIH